MNILIATPTYEKHEEFLPGFLAGVQAQTIPCDLLFANTSDDLAFGMKLQSFGKVIHIASQPTKYERVIFARQMLIQKFLEGTWSHLLFVDSDVFLPVHAAQKLLVDDLPVVSGVYLSPLNIAGKHTIVPVAYDFVDEEHRRPIAVAELFQPQLRRVHSVGFGCCMIKREVLEQVKLRPYQGGNASEDIFFCIDARTKGFESYLDTAVWATHHFWKLGDPRNKYLTEKWSRNPEQ